MSKKNPATPAPEAEPDQEPAAETGVGVALPGAKSEPAGDQAGDSRLPEDFLEVVFPPSGSYPPRYISDLIRIPIPFMGEARRAGELVASAGTHVGLHRVRVRGSDLIGWIRRYGIAWTATKESWRLYRQEKRAEERRAMRAREEAAEAKQGPTIIDFAEEALAERSRRAEQEAEQQRARQAADYRRLLLTDSPEPSDVEKLADMIEARGLDVQQMRGDMEFLQEASEAQATYDRVGDLEAEYGRAENAFREAKRQRELRHLSEGHDLETLSYQFAERTAMNEARGRLADARRQADTLKRLARARPEFFDTTTDPPRLLG